MTFLPLKVPASSNFLSPSAGPRASQRESPPSKAPCSEGPKELQGIGGDWVLGLELRIAHDSRTHGRLRVLGTSFEIRRFRGKKKSHVLDGYNMIPFFSRASSKQEVTLKFRGCLGLDSFHCKLVIIALSALGNGVAEPQLKVSQTFTTQLRRAPQSLVWLFRKRCFQKHPKTLKCHLLRQ